MVSSESRQRYAPVLSFRVRRYSAVSSDISQTALRRYSAPRLKNRAFTSSNVSAAGHGVGDTEDGGQERLA